MGKLERKILRIMNNSTEHEGLLQKKNFRRPSQCDLFVHHRESQTIDLISISVFMLPKHGGAAIPIRISVFVSDISLVPPTAPSKISSISESQARPCVNIQPYLLLSQRIFFFPFSTHTRKGYHISHSVDTIPSDK